MELETTEQKKKIPLVAGIVVGVFLLLALLIVLLPGGKGETPEETTLPTTETTQETFPEPSENVFIPLDFGYEGEYLTCLTAPSVRGIDISTFQKEVDWEQLKAAGFEFAILRAAYQGSEKGLYFEDEMVRTHYENAKAAGIKVGVYLFATSITPEEAVAGAEYVLNIVKDWQLDMPIVYDWEYVDSDYRNYGLDSRTLTDCAKAFCQTVEAAGFDSMVYFNPESSLNMMHLEELTDYGFWLAMYTDQMEYPYKIDMWQYTNQGSVPGIEGPVDINLYFPYDEE